MDADLDSDLLLALQLQQRFDAESSGAGLGGRRGPAVEAPAGRGGELGPYRSPERPLSIVDESWETLDPSPDVRAMFMEFNHKFFWGRLGGVEVKWSPRMTLCAGVCSYEGRGGLCSIRLSEPLLKLRPRKDLVQTLLHEMIHALLFVTQNNRDREGHGPEFCKHMDRINKASGTNITVYHSFHDEVDVYRQHWWRCNGPCQNRRPYFGYVKRAMNRAPSPLDPWWEDHRRMCGGTYTKIKEPEGYGKKAKKDGKKGGKTSEKSSAGHGKPSSAAGSGSQDIRNIIPFSGKGFLLGGSQSSTSSSPAHKPTLPAGKSPSSGPTPPRKPLTPTSPAKTLSSPVRPGLGNSVGPAATAGQKPPMKRSVSNTKVFVNINGSPVRIPKPQSGQGGGQVRQRSIDSLLNRAGIRRSVGPSSSHTETETDSLTLTQSQTGAASSFVPKQQTSSSKSSPSKSSTSQYPPLVPHKGSPAEPSQSKHFNLSNSDASSQAAARTHVARKRTWDERSSSAAIFDFFQKKLGRDSAAASRESGNTRSPAVQQGRAAAVATTPTPSSGSDSVSSSSSSSLLMVSCPVCQLKVQESKINEHLDSCLS